MLNDGLVNLLNRYGLHIIQWMHTIPVEHNNIIYTSFPCTNGRAWYWMGTMKKIVLNTIASDSILMKLITSVAATGIWANAVMAVLFTLVTVLTTLINICYMKENKNKKKQKKQKTKKTNKQTNKQKKTNHECIIRFNIEFAWLPVQLYPSEVSL